MTGAGTSQGGRRRALASLLGAALIVPWLATTAQSQECVGDCDMNGVVAINELIIGVNIALLTQPLSNCPSFDSNDNGTVDINELIQAVNNSLMGCPVETPTPGGPTPTPTDTPMPIVCPLTPGSYTVTNGEGSTLKVSTFAAFDFPAGGAIVQDVGAGDANCVHDVVVPFPGGFTAPTFCVPALGYSVHIEQTSCGVGRIDSDGGSDFTVLEQGDTSDTNGPCNLPQTPCENGVNATGRVDITVGDGTADTCTGSGVANALVVVPVFTVTWLAQDQSCPDADGMYDEGTDMLVTQFPQNLDFTTDTNTGVFTDLDDDGCFEQGTGPVTLQATGACLDTVANTVNTGAAGTIFSDAFPYDITFSSFLVNSVTGPDAPLGATCATPPAIDFSGTATRCIE
jgi:hypothetical protein